WPWPCPCIPWPWRSAAGLAAMVVLGAELLEERDRGGGRVRGVNGGGWPFRGGAARRGWGPLAWGPAPAGRPSPLCRRRPGAAWWSAVLPSWSRPLTSACSSSTRYLTAGSQPLGALRCELPA